MPSEALDPSWKLALNEAWARGLDFTQSAIFTYGPYAFLSAQQYHPATYPALLICSAFLGAVLFLLLRHIELGSQGRLYVFFILACLIASEYTSAPDVRFLCLAFLLLVAAAMPSPSEASGGDLPLLFSAPVVLSLGAFSLGLICLVKATYAVHSGIVGVLGLTALCATGRRLQAVAILVSFAVGLALFWVIAGQPLAELPRFFLTQSQVTAGYSDAMRGGGSLILPALFLLAAVPVAMTIRRELRAPTIGKYAVAISMAVTLFIGFKEGFVREDDWHALIAAEVLLILPWCWPSDRVDFWRKAQAAAAGLIVLVFLVAFPSALDLQGKAAEFGQVLHCSDSGPLVCPIRSGWLEKTYELSLRAIRGHMPLGRVQGTVDVYTVRQSLAIANGFRWDPRPLGQSYTAYTPALAWMDAEHLLGARAPEGILFALEPIDHQLPTLADGPSWPILLTRYALYWVAVPSRVAGEIPVAYVTHKPDSQRFTVARTQLLVQTAELGQKVDLPPSTDVLFARIDLRPNAFGRAAEALFRVPVVYINLLFPGGRVERYRFVPGMGRAGFIISPAVTDAGQFAALEDLQVRPALAARRPIAFWLSGAAGSRLVWTDAAAVDISALRERRE